MATYYYGAGGTNSGPGTSSSAPWATYAYAVANSTNGDTLVQVDGNLVAPASPGYFLFATDRKLRALNYRAAVMLADPAYSTYVAQFASTLGAGTYLADGHVYDGESRVTQCFRFDENAAADRTLQLRNAWLKDGVTYCGLMQARRGRIEIANVKLSGSPTTALMGSTTTLANTGNQQIDIQGMEFDSTYAGGATQTGLLIRKANNLTYTLDASVTGITGTMRCTSGSIIGIDLNGVAAPNCTNCDLTIESTVTGAEAQGIKLRGQSVAVSSDANISGNTINFKAPAGFAIMLGESTNDAFVTGGVVTGNAVIGQYYATATPHNFLMGQGTSGKCQGNVSARGYVGYLISKTTSCDMQGNIAYDCYGPAFYAKGATDFLCQRNVAIYSGAYDSAASQDGGTACIAVNAQTDATVNAGGTFQENLIIVADISKITALAKKVTGQTASFVRNTYVIPDTVDLLTTDLFAHDTTTGGAANNTLAEWRAQTYVTDDDIIQMPLAEIHRLIRRYKPAALGGAFARGSVVLDGITGRPIIAP